MLDFTYKYLLAIGLLYCAQFAVAQADVRVHVSMEAITASIDELAVAEISIINEGDLPRTDLKVQLDLSSALFFVEASDNDTFNSDELTWTVQNLAVGATKNIKISLRPNFAGIHTVTAELITADRADWDSTPNNGESQEDDQDDACTSVPVAVECGQSLVLSAPRGHNTYRWYRDGILLATAVKDTIHPSQSGAYSYEVGDKDACASGSCCPVVVSRTGCKQDMALTIASAETDDASFQEVTITLYNQGDGAITRADLYVTVSRMMRLRPGTDGWRLVNRQMKRTWEGMLQPGEQTQITFDIEAISGGTAADYRMFAEIEAMYGGNTRLTDIDSTPDDDPTNDLVVDDAYTLSSDEDEDDSDIASLSSCPLVTLETPATVCAGSVVSLRPTVIGNDITYTWSGSSSFSCTSCRETNFTAIANTQITLTTRTAQGCEEQHVVMVTTKDCLEDLQLVVSPYGPTVECLTLESGEALNWCDPAYKPGVTLAENRSNGATCINAASTGDWAGLMSACLEVCAGTDCQPVAFSLVVLPPRDEVEIKLGDLVCITDLLQTESTATNVAVSEGQNGLRLIDAGGDCYKLIEPAGGYPAQEFTVIHTYVLDGITVYDTTLLQAPGRAICDLEVFTSDTLYVDAAGPSQTSPNGATVCINGNLPDLRALSYEVAGNATDISSTGCNERRVATYSMRQLPAWYQDRGWRIVSYQADNRTQISGFSASTIDAVVARIQQVHPEGSVTFDRTRRALVIEGYTKSPGTLQLSHASTNTNMRLQPFILKRFEAWSLPITAGLAVGSYPIVARDSKGCVDETVLTILPFTQVNYVNDTFRISGQAGDPIVAKGLGGAVSSDARWTALNTDRAYLVATSTGKSYHTFTQRSASTVRTITYEVSVIARNCEPLLDKPTLSKSTDGRCQHNFAMGLTQPGLKEDAFLARSTKLNEVTGSRAGSVYDLNTLSHKGLGAEYSVTSWAGVTQIQNVAGNIAQITAELRKRGVDIYVNYTTGKLQLAGTGKGTLRLRDLTNNRTVTLSPVSNQLPTYGEFPGRKGTASVKIFNGYCKATLQVTINCERVIVWGNDILLPIVVGFPIDLNITDLGLKINATTWEILEETTKVKTQALARSNVITVLADAVAEDVLVIKACDDAGECRQVRVRLQSSEQQLCALDIWRPENTTMLTRPNTGTGRLILPELYDPKVHSILVNGRVKSEGIKLQEVVVSQQFDLKGYQAVSSPFGKTNTLTAGQSNDALTSVLAQADIVADGEMLSVSNAFEDYTIYAQDIQGRWFPMKPRGTRTKSRYVVELNPGDYTIEIKDEKGNCGDKLALTVVQPAVRSTSEVLELTVGNKFFYCLPEQEAGLTVVGIRNVCSDKSGERVAISQTGSCFEFENYEVGAESLCIVRDYMDGSRDSISVDLQVRAAREMTLRDDRDTVEFGQFHVIEVLANDDLLDEPRQLTLLSEPYFGRAQVVGNTAIEYLHYGADCALDMFTYEVCQGDECKTAAIEVQIFCDDLLIYNGFSPNGDGVNDAFTILGLGQYPDHKLRIFNRDGGLIQTFQDYKNDWNGDIGGEPLPVGTYFYVIELEDGAQLGSGYLQLSR